MLKRPDPSERTTEGRDMEVRSLMADQLKEGSKSPRDCKSGASLWIPLADNRTLGGLCAGDQALSIGRPISSWEPDWGQVVLSFDTKNRVLHIADLGLRGTACLCATKSF